MRQEDIDTDVLWSVNPTVEYMTPEEIFELTEGQLDDEPSMAVIDTTLEETKEDVVPGQKHYMSLPEVM